MPKFLKGLLAISLAPMFMVACTTSPQKTGKVTSSTGHRIYIPQEKVILERPVPVKTVPAAYLAWLSMGDNRSRVQEYERFLERNNVANVVPNFELLKTARDWQKCGRSQYAVPNRELWNNAIPTLPIS